MPDDTPRLPLIDDNPDDDALAATFASVTAAVGRVPNLYRTLGHAPEILDAWLAFAWPLRHEARTDRSTRELIIMRTAQLTGADYEWHQHWPMAVAAGVTEAQLEDLHRWPDSDAYSSAETAALRLTEELSAASALSDDAWAQLRAHYDDRACLELVMTAAFYQCVSRVLGGLGAPLEDDAPAVPPLDPATRAPRLTDSPD